MVSTADAAIEPVLMGKAVRDLRVPTVSVWLRWAPLLLLGVGVLLGWVLTPALLDPDRMRLSVAPTLVLLVLRVAAEAWHHQLGVSAPVVAAGYIVHAVALLCAVALNPFVCIYAFFGFLDAERFLGEKWATTAVVVTGLTCGFGQSGGLPGVTATPALFIALAGVNVTLAVALLRVGQSREREVAAREQEVGELARAQVENAALHDQLLEQAHATGIAEERARLSREMHDTVAQGLIGVIRQLENLPADLEPTIQRRVERAQGTARDCLTETRRAVRALGPRQLEDADLVAAVHAEAENWSLAQAVAAQVRVDGTPSPSPRDDVILRVVQEALANIARHAAASTVTITLSWLSEEMIADVRDDGVGFDPHRVVHGDGLQGMAERLADAGGRLIIESVPGEGTTVVAVLPR